MIRRLTKSPTVCGMMFLDVGGAVEAKSPGLAMGRGDRAATGNRRAGTDAGVTALHDVHPSWRTAHVCNLSG